MKKIITFIKINYQIIIMILITTIIVIGTGSYILTKNGVINFNSSKINEKDKSNNIDIEDNNTGLTSITGNDEDDEAYYYNAGLVKMYNEMIKNYPQETLIDEYTTIHSVIPENKKNSNRILVYASVFNSNASQLDYSLYLESKNNYKLAKYYNDLVIGHSCIAVMEIDTKQLKELYNNDKIHDNPETINSEISYYLSAIKNVSFRNIINITYSVVENKSHIQKFITKANEELKDLDWKGEYFNSDSINSDDIINNNLNIENNNTSSSSNTSDNNSNNNSTNNASNNNGTSNNNSSNSSTNTDSNNNSSNSSTNNEENSIEKKIETYCHNSSYKNKTIEQVTNEIQNLGGKIGNKTSQYTTDKNQNNMIKNVTFSKDTVNLEYYIYVDTYTISLNNGYTSPKYISNSLATEMDCNYTDKKFNLNYVVKYNGQTIATKNFEFIPKDWHNLTNTAILDHVKVNAPSGNLTIICNGEETVNTTLNLEASPNNQTIEFSPSGKAIVTVQN